MKTSLEGRTKLIAREGFQLKAYKDSVGVWTIGVGHTGRATKPSVVPGMVITKAEVDEILSRDLIEFEDAVNSAITKPMTQNQFDAMVSLAFNIGAPRFKSSTVVHKFNAGDIKGAADAFLLWDKPAVLLGRRKTERAQFLANTTTVTTTVTTTPSPPVDKPKAATAAVVVAAGTTAAVVSNYNTTAMIVALVVVAVGVATYLYFHFKKKS